jgi:hypothetical protein
MSENFGKGIPLATGFDLGAKSPLDARCTVDTIEERDEHVILNRAYDGMLVYVKETENIYRWNGNDWEIIPTKEYIDKAIENVSIDADELELSKYVSKNEFESCHMPINRAEIDTMIDEIFNNK